MRASSLCSPTLSIGVLACQGAAVVEALPVGSARSASLDVFRNNCDAIGGSTRV